MSATSSTATFVLLLILILSLFAAFVFDFPSSSPSSSSLSLSSFDVNNNDSSSLKDHHYHNYYQVQEATATESANVMSKPESATSSSLVSYKNIVPLLSSWISTTFPVDRTVEDPITSSLGIGRRRRRHLRSHDEQDPRKRTMYSRTLRTEDENEMDEDMMMNRDCNETTMMNTNETYSMESNCDEHLKTNSSITNSNNTESDTNDETDSNSPPVLEDKGSYLSYYLITLLMILGVFAWNLAVYQRSTMEQRSRIREEEERRRLEQEAILAAMTRKESLLIESEEEFNEIVPLITFQTYIQEFHYEIDSSAVSSGTTNNKLVVSDGDDIKHMKRNRRSSNNSIESKSNAGEDDEEIDNDDERKMPAMGLVPASIRSFFGSRETSTGSNTIPQTERAGITPRSDGEDEEEEGVAMKSITCSICVDEIVDPNEMVRMLPRCRHIYHNECIREWLLERKSDFCPICKVTVKKDTALQQTPNQQPLVSAETTEGEHNLQQEPAQPIRQLTIVAQSA